MTKPLVVTAAKARRLQRDNAKQGVKQKHYTGREILPGVVVHVADDVSPETMAAIEQMMVYLRALVDEGKIGKKRKSK